MGNSLKAQVLFSEIMYHPVEEPAFNSDGSPVLDLYEDVHEFIEIINSGSEAVALADWKITGGIRYVFPSNCVINPGEYLVIAKNPNRLALVNEYGLQSDKILGPYQGQLGNNSDSLRLQNASGAISDALTYSAQFPWAIGADALGADVEWTGINPATCQYRGRSLERVSYSHTGNDPANWLASPIPGNPSPARANAVSLSVPKPVILNHTALQDSDESSVIRKNQAVRIQCAFSATNGMENVRLEWFVDNIDLANEIRQTLSMTAISSSSVAYSTVIPGQADRSIVRYRFIAKRNGTDEVVSPRADDPYAWHGYFVTPVRTSSKPIYDCFISTSSLSVLQANITRSPRRITSPDPPGSPRASWNATEPAIMIHNGIVYDIRMRHHGSRYNRNAGRNSFKWQFPRYQKFNGITGIFETDKGNDFIVGHGLFRAIGLPVSEVRYVDLYLNNQGMMQRLEQEEYDGDMLDEYHQNQQQQNPGSALEPSGELYKDVGTIDMNGEGPYGRGDGRKLSKLPHWTDLQMYDWTFSIQNHGWQGSYNFKKMIDAFWVARGDTPTNLKPNIPAVRQFFTNYWDIDKMLTYVALENWCCPWDDTTQNHFLWRQYNGKWCMLPWDMDAWYGRGDNTPATSSLFIGEVGDRNNNYRGPNYFKDAFIKAFRDELKARFFLLNNTFLHPDNLTSIGFGSINSFAQQRFTSVNQQCGLGVFQRPGKPTVLQPNGGITALPPSVLKTQPYTHSASPTPPHAKTVWEIRSAAGTYNSPVWKSTSSNDLTAIAIPFAQLKFGQTFFWRCVFYDADGHPSAYSDEASFVFGPASSQARLMPINASTPWKYDQSGTDFSSTTWTSLQYDDSKWASGAPLFAKEEASQPEPIRTTLTIGKTTYYFRKVFTFPGNPKSATVRMRYVLDDGAVIYINGKELLRIRMPAGAVTYSTLSSQNVGDAAYEGPYEISGANFVTGENVIAVEVHQSNTSSSDVVFGLSLEADLPAVTGDLVINEIAARNSGSVLHGNSYPDWIELFNGSSDTMDISGYGLSDDVVVPGKYVFPSGTLIPAQGYLVVWCGEANGLTGLHSGFALNDKGQTVVLLEPQGQTWKIQDFVTFGLQIADYTIGRSGKGGMQLSIPTPGIPNKPQSLGSVSDLKINEWMAAPDSGDDWLEIFNPNTLPVALGGLFLSDDLNNPTNSQIPELSFIGAQDYVVFIADNEIEKGSEHVNFKLSTAGDAILLIGTNGVSIIDRLGFGPQLPGCSQGRLPDGALRIADFHKTMSPGDPNHLPLNNIVISEVLAHSDPPMEDAIELQNISNSAVDISGWWLSDDRRSPMKYKMPQGTILSPGAFLVIYEHQFNGGTNSSASFALSSARGDEVVLSESDALGSLTGYQTKVDFGASPSGYSFGRFPTSQGHDFTLLAKTSFGRDTAVNVDEFRLGVGGSNSVAVIGPVVISEIMYQPVPLGLDENYRDEYVELVNITGNAISLYDPQHATNTWRLADAIQFEFPPGTVLPPFGCIAVVSFDPQQDAASRGAFEAVYGQGFSLYGPFQGRLSNSGDSVELLRPDAPISEAGQDMGFVPHYCADRVRYSNSQTWPAEANGTGQSIHRVQSDLYGNDPQNWQADTPTAGQYLIAPLLLRLEISHSPDGAIHIGSSASTNRWILQRTDNMQAWENILTNQNQNFEHSEPNDRSRTNRFFRAILPK